MPKKFSVFNILRIILDFLIRKRIPDCFLFSSGMLKQIPLFSSVAAVKDQFEIEILLYSIRTTYSSCTTRYPENFLTTPYCVKTCLPVPCRSRPFAKNPNDLRPVFRQCSFPVSHILIQKREKKAEDSFRISNKSPIFATRNRPLHFFVLPQYSQKQ